MLPVSGRLYQLARDIKEKMDLDVRTLNAPTCAPFVVLAFEKRLKHLIHDFHRAARVVNPEYTDTGTTRDSALMPVFLRIVKAMLHDDPGKESKMSRIVRVEFPLFSARAGELHSDSDIRDAAKTMEPYKWWKDYGGDYPTLQSLAVRLLAQVCGAGDSERNWRDWDAVKADALVPLRRTSWSKFIAQKGSRIKITIVRTRHR